MNLQFGRWNFDGRPVPDAQVAATNRLLSCYAPDRQGSYVADGLHIACHAFHTTAEDRRGTQPFILKTGGVLVWDGRLDNREEILRKLENALSSGCSDVELVAAAYQQWELACLPFLVGDWALSVWNARERRLILAKDFAGTRHLYYNIADRGITWSSLLDVKDVFPHHSLDVEEEYVAGWLGFLPRPELTPYREIHSVPPASFVAITADQTSIHSYWNFDRSRRTNYKTDREYEEHFRVVFAESVKRRLRSDRPVVAELSGGMDSSSIVCMADRILRDCSEDASRLKTVSYFDESEPDWNELPFITKVEEFRACTGLHIDAGQIAAAHSLETTTERLVSPAAARTSTIHSVLAEFLRASGHRILLSGIGGDEVLGGVPAPEPELADLLSRGAIRGLFRQSVAWALATRRPVPHLIANTAGQFLPTSLLRVPIYRRAPSWLTAKFRQRYRSVLEGYNTRLRVTGSLPSFQDNVSTFDVLRRQLAVRFLSSDAPSESRCPYLDRDLVDFLYSVPRDQIVRPHQRRSLMRRALAGIVPREILERKRKAFVVRGTLRLLSNTGPDLLTNMAASELGIIDQKAFAAALEQARAGRELSLVALLRGIELERWLRSWRNSQPHAVTDTLAHGEVAAPSAAPLDRIAS